MYKTCYAGLAVLSTFPAACFGGLTTVFRTDVILLTAIIVGLFVACNGILNTIDYPRRQAGYIVTILATGTLTAATLGCLLGGFDAAPPTLQYFLIILTVPLGIVSGTAAYVSDRSVVTYSFFGWVLICVTAASFWIWGGYADTLAFLTYGLTATTIAGSYSFYEMLNEIRDEGESAKDDLLVFTKMTLESKKRAVLSSIGLVLNGWTGIVVAIGLAVVFRNPTWTTPSFFPFYATGTLLGTIALYPATKKGESWMYSVSVVVVFFANAGLTLAAVSKMDSIEYYMASLIGTEYTAIGGGVKGLIDALTVFGLTKTVFDSPSVYFWFGFLAGLNSYVIADLL